MGIRYTFHKSERLSDVRLIDAIFQKRGKVIFKPPVMLAYLEVELKSTSPAQVFFSVSKKKFQKATDRNRVKRMLREVYRLNKHRLYEALKNTGISCAVGIMFIGTEMPEYSEIDKQLNEAIDEFIKRYS